ncbi:MAG: hypothetical protein QXZ02_06500 [Candidatus Bathyarchaeia archaeon]
MKEQSLYPIVKKFLDSHFGCNSVQDKVVFNLLKNWKIDVVGAVKSDSEYAIIAVEVKPFIRPDTFLQAISQAEMYQKVSKRAYIAFPEKEILEYEKDYPEDWQKMLNIAKAKGIGVLSIGSKTCTIKEEATEFPQNPEVYKDIINQIEEYTLHTFTGFNHEDYDYFLGREKGRRNIVKRKIALFLKELKSKMLNNCGDFPSIDPKKLQVEIGNLQLNYCWCYISQEKTKRLLAQNAHFTIGINGRGISICVNMESDKAVSQFVKKAKSDQNALLKILQKLNEGCFLKIFERVPPPESPKAPHFRWEWIPVYEFYAPYIDKETLMVAIKRIESLQHGVVRLYCAEYTRDQEIIYSEDLIDEIFQLIKESQSFYSWVRQ